MYRTEKETNEIKKQIELAEQMIQVKTDRLNACGRFEFTKKRIYKNAVKYWINRRHELMNEIYWLV